jgi:hypothetical protein
MHPSTLSYLDFGTVLNTYPSEEWVMTSNRTTPFCPVDIFPREPEKYVRGEELSLLIRCYLVCQ